MLLSVRDVTLRFGGIVALDGVSFDVERGIVSGLIGPNGAGKTTVFNVITRLYTPDAGEVDLDGQNPAWYCKTLRDETTKLERDFATMFGTNPNNANAFGKCVSQRAHELNGSDAAGGDNEQGEDDPCEASGNATSADSGTESESSDDAATDPEACTNDDSESEEPADEEQSQGDDEQGEDDQGEDEDGASGELDSSDLAAVVRFLTL